MNKTITELLGSDKEGFARAVSLLRKGQLVSFPTETVYGLGADARNNKAVAKIFAAKNRPTFNPLIVHVANLEMAEAIAVFGAQARQLSSAFWPGPLTLVLPLRSDARIADLVTAGLDTIALRMPAHEVAVDLIAQFGGPIAAPSANPSGKVSPTRAQHVLAGLNGRIAAVLDGGSCGVGVESTIVGFENGPTLLRPGGLPAEIIEECLGQSLATTVSSNKPTAPGQLASHYATSASIRLNVTQPNPDEVLLGFGDVTCDLNLSQSGNMIEAAANLFHHLRILDESGVAKIAVSPIANQGLGRAINDRLKRAAAPRP